MNSGRGRFGDPERCWKAAIYYRKYHSKNDDVSETPLQNPKYKIVALLILVLLLIGVTLVAGYLWQKGETIARNGETGSEGTADIGGPFQLTNQYGRSVSNADYQGRYELIYFGYSFCPDICPTTLAMISEAIGKLGTNRNRIVPIFITVDPTRDAPTILKSYLGAFDPGLVGLTGSQAQISEVEKKFHIFAQKHPFSAGGYAVDHSSLIYLMGPDGRFIKVYDGSVSPDELAKALNALN